MYSPTNNIVASQNQISNDPVFNLTLYVTYTSSRSLQSHSKALSTYLFLKCEVNPPLGIHLSMGTTSANTAPPLHSVSLVELCEMRDCDKRHAARFSHSPSSECSKCVIIVVQRLRI